MGFCEIFVEIALASNVGVVPVLAVVVLVPEPLVVLDPPVVPVDVDAVVVVVFLAAPGAEWVLLAVDPVAFDPALVVDVP